MNLRSRQPSASPQSGDGNLGLLFIHGGFGHGKTHLLNAIALEVREQHRARALFLRAEDFMRRFLAALRNQETLAFKEELRAADILLIDDLQHICGRITASEFLHTVNAFTDLKRKVVIAADRAPSALDGLTEDIRSRLKGAVSIAIERPDAATRLAILRAKSSELERKLPRAKMPDSVLQLMAEEVHAAPRELLGVLLKLATYADLTGKTGDAGNRRGSDRQPQLGSGYSAPALRKSSARPPNFTNSICATCIRHAACDGSHGRGRWRCSSRASLPRGRCPISAGALAAATTPRFCMPAAGSRNCAAAIQCFSRKSNSCARCSAGRDDA